MSARGASSPSFRARSVASFAKWLIPLAYLFIVLLADQAPRFVGLNIYVEGVLFLSIASLISWPFYRVFRRTLAATSSDGFVQSSSALSLTVVTICFLTASGVFLGLFVAMLLLCSTGALLLFADIREGRTPPMDRTATNAQAAIPLLVCGLIFLYYSAAPLINSDLNYCPSGADLASTAHLALYEFEGFPRIPATFPVVIDENGLARLSTVHVLQPAWSSSLVGVMSLATGLNVFRSSYWIWLLSPLFIFTQGLAMVLSFFRGWREEKNVLYWIPAFGLILHNHQFHFLFVNGEYQELYAMGLLYTSLSLIRIEKYALAGITVAAALSWQPDISFAWAVGIGLWVLWTKPGLRRVAAFGLSALVALGPFLVQQIMIYLDTKAVASGFAQDYQYLALPGAMFRQFSWTFYGVFVCLGLLLILKSNLRSMGWFFLGVFCCFAFYPWLLVALDPSLATWATTDAFPMSAFVGTFRDVIFPFYGKFYFYRTGLAWFFMGFSGLGLVVLCRSIRDSRIQKWTGIALTVVLCALVLVQHQRRRIVDLTWPLISRSSVDSLESFLVDYHPTSGVLVPSRMVFTEPAELVYEHWWTGPYLNQIVSEGRAYRSNSDIFVDGKSTSTANYFADAFWAHVLSEDASREEKEKWLETASEFYRYLIAPTSANYRNPCSLIAGFPQWVLLERKDGLCLFQKR